jgi:hypothetical protein
MPIRIYQHFAGGVTWRGAAGLDDGTQCSRLMGGFEFGNSPEY